MHRSCLVAVWAAALCAFPASAQQIGSQAAAKAIKQFNDQAIAARDGAVLGKVEGVDAKASIFKVKMPKAKTVITFAYLKPTKFFFDGQAGDASRLQIGQEILVRFDIETNRARQVNVFIENNAPRVRNNYRNLEPREPEATPAPSRKTAKAKKKAGPPQEPAPAPDKETAAAGSLELIKQLIADGKTETARFRLEKFGERYPGTKAAAEAKKLLERMD